MITIDDKLFITKEINEIVVSYAKEVVLNKLLLDFSYDTTSSCKNVSKLIQKINPYFGDTLNPIDHKELLNFIKPFLENLNKKELTSLYFWTLNKEYLRYINEDEISEEEITANEFNENFGRGIAYKIYEPKSSGLLDDLLENLESLLINFASEFDFSLLDEFTYESIDEMIESYTK